MAIRAEGTPRKRRGYTNAEKFSELFEEVLSKKEREIMTV